jgi:hydrophobe/amphiphile efflux-3 (HAE3) family protein
MEKFSQLIVKWRLPVVIATIGLTIWLGYRIKDLSMDSDILNSLPEDDTIALTYKNIGGKFGGNSMGMVILKTGNVFTTEVLEDVKMVTDTLSVLPGISTVTSLTNVIEIKGGDGGIEVGHLLDEYDLPRTQGALDSLRRRVMAKDMYRGNLVSSDGSSTIVMFTLLDGADKRQVAQTVKKKITGLHLPEKVYFGGLPMMMDDVGNLMRNDMNTLLPVTVIVIMLVLYLSFKSVRGVLLPLVSAAISIVWVMGIMQIAGYRIDLITNELPIVLLAVGSAYTIHVINRINEEKGKDRKKALIKALAYITIPVFLSGITTVFGFASFIFGAYLTMIKHFGIFTSLGVFFALFISVVFIPAFISLFSIYNRKNRFEKKSEKENAFLVKRFLKPFAGVINNHPEKILITSLVLVLVSGAGIFKIKTSVNMSNYFEKDNPTRITDDLMKAEFGGSLPLFVDFKGDMQDPRVLKTMDQTEEYMKKFPYVNTTQSVAGLIKQMNDVMGEGEKIPDSRAKIENLWFLLDGQDIMSQLVDDDLSEGIIQSRFASGDTKDMEDFVVYMNHFIKEHSNDKCTISLTGMPSVYVKLNNSLIKSQFTSLGLAVLLVILIVGLILKSLKKGIYAAIPIVATIIILFGFMGYAGIALDVATVLVASVALGMGIDYSIHIITHFYNDLSKTADIKKAVNRTVLISGKAITINVASVAAGFLVLLFSHIVPIQNFGLLVALSMIGSGFGALSILPVILVLAEKRHKTQNID